MGALGETPEEAGGSFAFQSFQEGRRILIQVTNGWQSAVRPLVIGTRGEQSVRGHQQKSLLLLDSLHDFSF